MNSITVTELFILGSALALLAVLLKSSGTRSLQKIVRENGREVTSKHEEYRHTDKRKLKRKELKIKAKADELVTQAQPGQAAELYCSINLHRQAISCLENAGLIDEACQILLKMGRPNRAGAVYERNRIPQKAGFYFLTANMLEDAARCFVAAGKTNPDFYLQAAVLFERVHKYQEAVWAYSLMGRHENIAKLCFEKNLFELLRDYCQDSKTIRGIFLSLDNNNIKQFIQRLPLDGATANAFALWTTTLRKLEFVFPAIIHLSQNQKLLVQFYSNVRDEILTQILLSILQHPMVTGEEGGEFLHTQAVALFDSKRYDFSARLFENIGELLNAAMCHIHRGELDWALSLLKDKNGGLPVLGRELEKIMKQDPKILDARNRSDPWSKATLQSTFTLFQSMGFHGLVPRKSRHEEEGNFAS